MSKKRQHEGHTLSHLLPKTDWRATRALRPPLRGVLGSADQQFPIWVCLSRAHSVYGSWCRQALRAGHAQLGSCRGAINTKAYQRMKVGSEAASPNAHGLQQCGSSRYITALNRLHPPQNIKDSQAMPRKQKRTLQDLFDPTCEACNRLFETVQSLMKHQSTSQACAWYKRGKLKEVLQDSDSESETQSEMLEGEENWQEDRYID
ncbi:uncharacterized protein B0H18DRAFT_950984 [Fomitopsis serialis]|uniref:uncharacterized protein n=1 Tax=Fomitopsis serialis TaxID=139415 RepID=UPI0020078B9A|nr:uncharacterized protein B0H18DRAFT_950984 [Neoantrodia serialis]KAH9935431.1 hypothetical protein B0H18DRAFT_950984 [Neoantrodia serialis]